MYLSRDASWAASPFCNISRSDSKPDEEVELLAATFVLLLATDAES
jgi:hypothetical protein